MKINIRKLIVKLNQDFSFFGPMMRGKKGKTVFFPGCAFMKLGEDIINKTLLLIKKIDKNATVCSICCSKPSKALGNNYQNRQKDKIVKFLTEREVETIYTACPNCFCTLNSIKNEYKLNTNIVMLYKLLSDNIDNIVDSHPIDKKVVIHDPCIIRNDEESQKSVRRILDKINQEYIEPSHSMDKTICCGNIDMINVLEPEKSFRILKMRLDELLQKADIICSYCSGCLNSFEEANAKVIHIMELVFGKVENKSIMNRLKFTMGIPKK